MMSLAEIQALLTGDDPTLFSRAHAMQREVWGDQVFVRGIIEFSSHCIKRCHYCGLRRPNGRLRRYRMTWEEVERIARTAPHLGVGTIILQCGEDPALSIPDLCRTITRIRRDTDLAITLSLGERSEDELRRLRDAGADRYLLKLETTDPRLHARLRPGQSLRQRRRALETIQRLGFEAGSGVIVGLPGATLATLAQDLRTLAALGLQMLAVGPFIPHPHTPLRDASPGDGILSLRATAVLRLLCPTAHIPATSALAALPEGDALRVQALRGGCTVLMPSLTPEQVRADYAIYPGKNRLPASQAVELAHATIRRAGLVPSHGRGDCLRRPPCTTPLAACA